MTCPVPDPLFTQFFAAPSAALRESVKIGVQIPSGSPFYLPIFGQVEVVANESLPLQYRMTR